MKKTTCYQFSWIQWTKIYTFYKYYIRKIIQNHKLLRSSEHWVTVTKAWHGVKEFSLLLNKYGIIVAWIPRKSRAQPREYTQIHHDSHKKWNQGISNHFWVTNIMTYYNCRHDSWIQSINTALLWTKIYIKISKYYFKRWTQLHNIVRVLIHKHKLLRSS